jgi:uncharacterized protein (PEP-CTERM system associated)
MYNEHRAYQTALTSDSIYGASAGWQWQIEPRLTFYLQPSWQSTRSAPIASNSNLYEVSLGLTRGIPINLGRPLLLNATLDLRHIEQKSNVATADYTENRATANFFVQF